MPAPTRPHRVDAWLPLFFAAHAAGTVALLRLLGVQAPRYGLLPWAFGLATLVTLGSGLRLRLLAGSLCWRVLPPLFYFGVISLASSVAPRPSVGVESNSFHPAEYAALGLLVQAMMHRGGRLPPRVGRIALGIVLSALAGGLDELHQSQVPGRDASLLDLGLDLLGAALGAALYLLWDRLGGRQARGGGLPRADGRLSG